MTRPHPVPGGASSAAGTDEASWRGWLAGRDWPALRPADLGGAVLVCAAHPDDDVLGAGALLHALAAAGTRLRFLLATDGEGSHSGSRVVSPAELATRRRAESAAALAALGVQPEATTRLGLPDGALAARGAELAAGVRTAAEGVSAVLAPWSGDGHPDHEALGRAAEDCAARSGLPLLAFPVWAWEWAGPGDGRLPWDEAVVAAAGGPARSAKRRAVDCFTTQVTALGPDVEDAAVLSSSFLAHFDRDGELFFRATPGRRGAP